MTGPRQPWWYSGDESGREVPAEAAPPVEEPARADPPSVEGGGSGMDWTSLVVGAQRVVEWATERVMVPHAEHEDPAAHPECLVCRTMLLIGESGRGAAAPHEPPAEADESAFPASPAVGAGQIQWIPIREGAGEA